MIPAPEALERLRAGNRRFVAEGGGRAAAAGDARRRELVAGQEPFAVVLGCSDSRVPAEIVFDQGLGDLFVVRVAGNVAAPAEVGSVEFAAAVLGSRLVVVLGHSDCGAVQATLAELRSPSEELSPNLWAIVERVRPAVEPLFRADRGGAPEALEARAVRANVRHAAERLRQDSEVLRGLMEGDGLRVVGAEYSLESGEVEFFDGVSVGG